MEWEASQASEWVMVTVAWWHSGSWDREEQLGTGKMGVLGSLERSVDNGEDDKASGASMD